jgi:ubiquinone biosynthesis monooxygenase Coq7
MHPASPVVDIIPGVDGNQPEKSNQEALMETRKLSPVDKLIMQADSALKTLFDGALDSSRPYPANGLQENDLGSEERKHAAGLMRVNHSGEVSAQGLYQGQALTARLPGVRQKMEEAASEEVDHLAWCAQRLDELGSYKSRLNPVWYTGSFLIGASAGLLGDKWSLGFVAETEKQVVLHLEKHLSSLPEQDIRSRAIIEQMKTDEAKHATTALHHGGANLPAPVKILMELTSKVMTRAAYWV